MGTLIGMSVGRAMDAYADSAGRGNIAACANACRPAEVGVWVCWGAWYTWDGMAIIWGMPMAIWGMYIMPPPPCIPGTIPPIIACHGYPPPYPDIIGIIICCCCGCPAAASVLGRPCDEPG